MLCICRWIGKTCFRFPTLRNTKTDSYPDHSVAIHFVNMSSTPTFSVYESRNVNKPEQLIAHVDTSLSECSIDEAEECLNFPAS